VPVLLVAAKAAKAADATSTTATMAATRASFGERFMSFSLAREFRPHGRLADRGWGPSVRAAFESLRALV
jgi:hypothetical protein